MQSSYRIIKNEQVSYAAHGVPVSDIKYKKSEEDISVEKQTAHEELIPDIDVPEIDIEQIRAEIREELRKELEIENEKVIREAIQIEKKQINDEAEIIKKMANDKGFQEGFRAGYEKGIADCKEICDEMKAGALKLIQQAEKEVKEYFKDNKDKLIHLAGEMAESIVHSAIDLSSENVLQLIRPIIQLYEKSESIIITCTPSDSQFLKSRLNSLEDICPGTRFIILEDSNLEEHGCIIENENQIIDLQISKQINSIIEDMRSLGDKFD